MLVGSATGTPLARVLIGSRSARERVRRGVSPVSVIYPWSFCGGAHRRPLVRVAAWRRATSPTRPGRTEPYRAADCRCFSVRVISETWCSSSPRLVSTHCRSHQASSAWPSATTRGRVPPPQRLSGSGSRSRWAMRRAVSTLTTIPARFDRRSAIARQPSTAFPRGLCPARSRPSPQIRGSNIP
jgi:hypothetical protein